MRRIKLFESFNVITEEEIRGSLVELQDKGYYIETKKTYNGYTVFITVGSASKGSEEDEFFNIIDVSEPILELISY